MTNLERTAVGETFSSESIEAERARQVVHAALVGVISVDEQEINIPDLRKLPRLRVAHDEVHMSVGAMLRQN